MSVCIYIKILIYKHFQIHQSSNESNTYCFCGLGWKSYFELDRNLGRWYPGDQAFGLLSVPPLFSSSRLSSSGWSKRQSLSGCFSERQSGGALLCSAGHCNRKGMLFDIDLQSCVMVSPPNSDHYLYMNICDQFDTI